jgi:hypothetical protein
MLLGAAWGLTESIKLIAENTKKTQQIVKLY